MERPEIPQPELLDPNRNDLGKWPDDLDRVMAALRDSCAYATDLWQTLDAVREYLLILAGEGEKPTVLHDGHDWEQWAIVYAGVTSRLAGATGDNGFGESEAKRIAGQANMQVLQ